MEDHTRNPATEYLDSIRSRIASGSFYKEPSKRLPEVPTNRSGKAKPADHNERTRNLLKEMGYWAYRADYYDHLNKIHHDLFGIYDWIALKDGETVGVQHTSASGMSARRTKIKESKAFTAATRAGWKTLLIGWKKNASGRWEAKTEWL